MKIKTKILVLTVLSNLLLGGSLYLISYQKLTISNKEQISSIRTQMVNDKKEYLKDIVQTSFSVMEKYAELDDSTEAQSKVKEFLSTPRYDIDKSAYLFAYQINEDNSYSFAFHGTKKKLWGKSTDITKPDPNGVPFRKLLIEGALEGGKFVNYSYAKGGSKELKPKMAYARHFKKWNWVLVGGIYIDNIDESCAIQTEKLNGKLSGLLIFILISTFILVIITTLVALWVSAKMTKPITTAVDALEHLALGDTDFDITVDANDEIELIQNATLKVRDSINQSAVIAESIADGDLTSTIQPLSDADRLGNAFKKMSNELNNVIFKISTASHEVDSGSQQVSASSQHLSEGATTSAASIEEISSSMTEIESQVKASAENATQASQLSASARDVAGTGSSEMTNMLEAMTGISESSQQIAKIIKVIDDIAFQTNLLALNAAVEAARAGQHGKGFAVVAEEVRSLAGRSAKAARETAELIEDAVKRVDNGNEIAEKTGEALSGIVEQVTKVNDLVGEIASASNEQAQGISQVTVGLEQIDNVTQSNTANAEETAAASEELSSQAAELQHSIAQFKLKNEVTTKSTPKQPAIERAPTKKKLPIKQAQATDSWGKDDNESIISLDDNDFGKY